LFPDIRMMPEEDVLLLEERGMQTQTQTPPSTPPPLLPIPCIWCAGEGRDANGVFCEECAGTGLEEPEEKKEEGR
jgi:hypothetical protein